ncbi:MAG: hypothetical protein WBB34_10695 [Xanthobacteraceae bacterium]
MKHRLPLGGGMMAGLFAEGYVGAHSDNGVWGGARFYFGRKDKTLIRRHREDDPPIWNNGSDAIDNSGGQSAPSGPLCLPPRRIIGGVCRLT